ncbi:MAG: LPXTG cell wall anchor domain-containing protein [Pseudomonadota bacterium]
MQQRTPFLTSILAGATALLLAAAQARAAELGDVTVRSFIGQPLAADIELVQLAPDEVSALQVKLAQPDVFRGANITMNPALGSVHMSIYRRDGRQFLHVTTTRNIDAEYVHLFLELGVAGRQDVRAATVWLQVDPNPAPPPPPVQLALPAARGAEPVVAAPAAPVAAVPAAPQRARPAPLPSAHESEVGKPGDLKAAAGPAPASRRVSPPAPVAKSAVSAEPVRAEGMVPLTVAQALLPLPPLPLPKGVKRPADPAACAPSGMTAKECVALDGHSAALSSKLVELEGKVKMLQGALGAATSPARKAVAAPASPAPAAASASASQAPAPVARAASAKAASAATAASAASGGASAEAAASVKKVRVLPKLKYKKEKDKPAESGFGTTTMIAAGAGLLLLLGAGGYVLLRKKRGSGPLKIWQGFRKKKPAGEGGAAQEAQPLHAVTPESMLQP